MGLSFLEIGTGMLFPNGILSSVFYEFSDQSDYLHSLIIGTPAGAHLKAMIDHSKGHR